MFRFLTGGFSLSSFTRPTTPVRIDDSLYINEKLKPMWIRLLVLTFKNNPLPSKKSNSLLSFSKWELGSCQLKFDFLELSRSRRRSDVTNRRGDTSNLFPRGDRFVSVGGQTVHRGRDRGRGRGILLLLNRINVIVSSKEKRG